MNDLARDEFLLARAGSLGAKAKKAAVLIVDSIDAGQIPYVAILLGDE